MLLLIKQLPFGLTTRNGQVSVKVGAEVLSHVVIFSILSSDISLDFHKKISLVWVKSLK